MVVEFFNIWHLKMSMPKTVSTVFHLANPSANRELKISLNGTRLNLDRTPKYLGVTLDRNLTFHEHVIAIANKTQARVSLLRKHARTSLLTLPPFAPSSRLLHCLICGTNLQPHLSRTQG